MGDDGRLYLSPDLVPIYKDKIAKLATILTPNQFEAEQLSSVTIDSKQAALEACEVLHAQGTQTVVGVYHAHSSSVSLQDNYKFPMVSYV